MLPPRAQGVLMQAGIPAALHCGRTVSEGVMREVLDMMSTSTYSPNTRRDGTS